MNCRHCHSPLEHVFVDLGFAPPSNAYRTREQLRSPETYLPLRVYVCEHCWLVQTDDYTDATALFDAEYAYFSSTSSSWLAHAAQYTRDVIQRLSLDTNSLVIEVASNDGYLLKNFVAAGIPCLGVEPTASTATAAERLGIPVLREFFGEALARRLAGEGRQADLIVGNNVYAHVPDINDFTRGLKAALKPGGTITLEFPHLMQLIENTQFDTIYHEHFSYLSLGTVSRIFESAGLKVFDVQVLATHGGSLRVYGCHGEDPRRTSDSVTAVLKDEVSHGLRDLATYLQFQRRAERLKDELLDFLLMCKRQNHRVAAYGAAAKGNTLLNFAGIKRDLLPMVCDAAVAKQGKLLPGSHIPILAPQALDTFQPDYIVVLPWNLMREVRQQLSAHADRGCRFVTAVPRLEIT
jgi:SAM-dependent methyltransferase